MKLEITNCDFKLRRYLWFSILQKLVGELPWRVFYIPKNSKAPFPIFEEPCGTPRMRTYLLQWKYIISRMESQGKSWRPLGWVKRKKMNVAKRQEKPPKSRASVAPNLLARKPASKLPMGAMPIKAMV